MFRSQAMHKVELIIPEHDVVAVTEALADSHVFHVVATDEAEAQELTLVSEWVQRASIYEALEHRITEVMILLDVDIGRPPEETPHLISPDLAERDVGELEEEAKGPVEELQAAQEQLHRLQHMRDQIASLAGLDVPIERFRSARYVFSMLGSMPVENVERLETSLEHVPSTLVTLRERHHLATVVLFGLRRDAEILARAARSAYLNPMELPPQYDGTPEEILSALDEQIRRAREQIATDQEKIHYLHATRIRRLRGLFWRVRASRRLVETVAKFQQFRYTYLAIGWVPEAGVAQLQARIKQVSQETVIEVLHPTAQEWAEAPFKFQNPAVVRIFEPLVTTYGYPRYGELDPTPLLAITFPLIFGVMFGDVGHGLILMLLGLLLWSRRIEALRGAAQLGGVMLACGGASFIFGFLYGSLFGFEDVIAPLWLRPLERTTDILLVAVVMGMGVLTLGMIYNIVDAVLRRRWGEVLFDRNGLAGMLFYWSLIGLGAGAFGVDLPLGSGVLAIVGLVTALAIAASSLLVPWVEGEEAPESAEIGLTLVEGFFELFETLLSLLSNTLSYVRMGAFAVAHGALSLVVFILARLVGPAEGIIYWIVVVLGTFVVIGFEGMIVAIQTLRLEYYELFSKFFSAGGDPYQPLTLTTLNERT